MLSLIDENCYLIGHYDRGDDDIMTELKLNPTLSGIHAQILHVLRKQWELPTYPEVIRKLLEEYEGGYFIILSEKKLSQLESMLQFPHLRYETGCLTVEDLLNWIVLKGVSQLKKKIGTIYDLKVRIQLDHFERLIADLLAKTAYDPEYALGMTIEDLEKLTRLEQDQVKRIIHKLMEKGLITEHPELKGHFFVLI